MFRGKTGNGYLEGGDNFRSRMKKCGCEEHWSKNQNYRKKLTVN